MLTRILSAVLALAMISLCVVPSSALEDPSSRRARQQREAQNYPNQALEAFNNKDYDLAITLYTKAIDSGAFKSQPEAMGQLYYGRGLSYQAKQDCASAVPDFDKAIEFVNKGEHYFARARCHLDLKAEDKALNDIDSAIKTDPEAPMYRSARCILLFNKKDFVGALPDCEKALAATPNDKNLLMATSQASEQTGNRARAAELYRKLLVVDPGNPVATEGLKRVGG